MRKYFGTDGIRGVANKDLTPEFTLKLGKTLGHELRKISDDKITVLIGRDTRLSGHLLEAALISGLLSVGANVMRLGVISTPGVAFLTKQLQASAGIMISASHNPYYDNGIKIFGTDGYKLSDEEEIEIEKLLESSGEVEYVYNDEIGRVENYYEGSQKYLNYLQKTVTSDFSGMKIALDCANGATTNLAPQLFASLGAEIEVFGNQPNGTNINDNIGSTHPEKLSQFVLEKECDFGFAFDGDGDRLIAVDHLGNIINGDQIMYVIGNKMKEEGTLKDSTVVTTILSNYGLIKALEENGLNTVQAKVGDRYVLEEMKKNGYNFGGEQSGHLILLDHSTTGDGMLSALQLVEAIKTSDETLNDLANKYSEYPQVAKNERVEDKDKIMQSELLINTVELLKEELSDQGTIILRPSGTEPVVRVNVTASSIELAEEYADKIIDIIKEIK